MRRALELLCHSAVSSQSSDVFRSEEAPSKLIARNVAGRYAALIVDTVIGLALLPFNVSHLGAAAYGVWLLASSVTVHFSVLDLGFGGAFVRFVARYRARRDARALNEIASTLFFVYAGAGVLAYLVAAGVAFNLGAMFRITTDQAEVGRSLLLIIGVQVALNFPFSVFGGVVNGFQRYNVNAGVAVASSIAVAAANIAVLSAGYGLVPLVLATTSIRIATYFAYWQNARRIYPALRVTPTLFKPERLRELMGFSVYSLLIDIGYRLNYQVDQLVIGTFLGVTPIAVWAPASRIVTAMQQLTNQLNAVLFPVVVDSDAVARADRLRRIFLHGTRLSLAMVLPIGVTLVALADPLIHAWVGSRVTEMQGAVPVLQILSIAIMIRVGAGTATTLLKGGGMHRFMATVSILTGIANVVVSVALVRPLGLRGVAFGTLIPVACSTFFFVFPAACRRADVTLRVFVGQAIWPALWPALVIGGAYYALLPRGLPRTLPVIAVESMAGGLLYLALFGVMAIGRRDREMYTSVAAHLLNRPRLAPAEI
jgi:O-antigen/teichoic acid export membrane protein